MKTKFAAIALAVILPLLCCFGCTDDGTSLPPTQLPGDASGEQAESIVVRINGNTLRIELADTDAARALAATLRNGNVSYTARDYGGFEKVGSLGFDLPRDDERITARVGDVMLYSGDQIVIFYGSNTWSYTRIGRIEGYGADELRAALGAGDKAAELSLG